MTVLLGIYGFLSGILLGSLGIFGWRSIIVILFSIFVVLIYKNFYKNKHKQVLIFICIFLCMLAIGVLRIHFSDAHRSSQLQEFVETPAVFTGIIVAEPDIREKNTKLTVRVATVSLVQQNSSTTKHISEKIIISTNLYPEFSYGDKISFKTKLSVPKNIESDSGRVFDYAGYLRARGVWYTASFVYPQLLSHGHGSLIKTFLFRIKKTFTRAIENALPEPESSLLSGLLLGAKQSLGKDLLEQFSRTGVSHIVVLSGYNIAIVAESIMAVLVFLPVPISFAVGCVSIIMFTILAGGGASAVRAAIMVLVALFAKRFNRDYKAGRAFGFAVVLMLAPNPLLLVFDPSFQLSVLATIGIIFVSPVMTHYFLWVTERYGMREIVSSTIATQLTVLPFLVYNTGVLSIVSLPVNVLILGTIPTTMFLGFLTGLCGVISLWLSFIPALPTYILLWYQLFVVRVGNSVPFGSLSLPAFPFWVVCCVYFVIAYWLYVTQKKTT